MATAAAISSAAPSTLRLSRRMSDLSVCMRPAGICGSHVAFSTRAHRIGSTAASVPTCLQLSAGLRLSRPDLRLQIATRRSVDATRQRATTVAAVTETATSIIQVLPPNFGYVALTAAASAIMVQWQAVMVALQRKKLGIKYPKMYEDKEDSVFNCYQRAHANTLESYPQFLVLLLISGLVYPNTATILGSVWVLGRIFYSLGYYSGDPKKRLQGAWNQFGLFGLIITAAVVGVKQLT